MKCTIFVWENISPNQSLKKINKTLKTKKTFKCFKLKENFKVFLKIFKIFRKIVICSGEKSFPYYILGKFLTEEIY